nr:vWA domain-containing protein [Treponema phagedenis]
MLLTILTNSFAVERKMPVDIYLMIDKSLSMQEKGKFDSLYHWVRDELIGQMMVPGDWITVYQFYEKPEELLTLTMQTENDRDKIIRAVDTISPNGKYTDIGLALDKIAEIQQGRAGNGRYKVLLLVTDLEQDAPWTSKYSGKEESFQSPYLAEARIIKHDNWFEITLDMAIQDKVVHITKELYSDVLENKNSPRTDSDQNKALIRDEH